jgi:hypothetical protein
MCETFFLIFSSKKQHQVAQFLVFISFITFSLHGVKTDFLVILLKGSQILTGLGELTLFHTFSNVPMDKGTFGVHEVKLVVKTSPSLSNGSGVGQHADGTLDLGKVTTGHNSGRLVVDTNFETSGTPVHKLDGALGFDGGNGSIDILGDNIASVQEATGHVLAVTGIAFDHLVGRFKASIGDLRH